MKEVGHGIYEVEPGDSEALDKLGETVEAIAQAERERLNAERGHDWWADAVFYLHDLISFGSLTRKVGNGGLADALSEITTKTAHSLLVKVLGSDEKASEAWSLLLEDASKLDDILVAQVKKDIGGEPLH